MPNPKKPQSSLRWDKQVSRYRAPNGRFVARKTVLTARDTIVDDSRRQLRAISEAYVNGKITLLDWQIQMKDTIKAAHTLSAGIAMGGKVNMTPSDWGRVGQMLRVQYEALNRFALDLEAGKPMHFGRVDQYGKAVGLTFQNAERLQKPLTQMARWVRSVRESCEGCRTQSYRGVQPLVMFPAIGSQNCRMNCHCRIEYVTQS